MDEFGVTFSADRKKLVKIPKGLHEYYIPDGVKIIGRNAFSDSSETLEHIYIPKSVERIDDFAFYTWQKWDKLESLDVPNSVQSIGYYAFLAVENVNYYGSFKTGYPWGAKRINGKPNTAVFGCIENSNSFGRVTLISTGRTWGQVTIQRNPSFEIYYEGWLKDGKPDGDGTYYKVSMGGTEVIHDLPADGTGYGTSYDKHGNLYTGKWINGYTEDEWDELMHDIN